MTTKERAAAWKVRGEDMARIAKRPKVAALRAAFVRAESLEKAAWLKTGRRPAALSARADGLYKALTRRYRSNPSKGIAAHRARARRAGLRSAAFRRMQSGIGVEGIGRIEPALSRAMRVARGPARKRMREVDSAIQRLERLGVVTAWSSPDQQRRGTTPAGPRAKRLRALQGAYARRVRINPRRRPSTAARATATRRLIARGYSLDQAREHEAALTPEGQAERQRRNLARLARRNPRKGRMAKRKRNRLGHFVKETRRRVRRARNKLGQIIAGRARKKRRTRRNPRTGGGSMSRALVANPRRRRKRRAAKITRNPRRRRRVRARSRRHYRRNPGGLVGAAMASILPMGLGGIGGAAAGFVDAKFLSDSPVLSALSKVAAGALGAVVLRRRPALAYGWAGGVLGSFGYSMGVKAAGGLVAHSPSAALKGIADMAGENPEMAALLEGLGDLQPLGDADDGTLGDSDYNASLGDTDGAMGDLIEG